MSKTFFVLGIIAVYLGMSAGAKEVDVKRLDDSTIPTTEIDSTVTRLMRAAEVTGVGIVILVDGKLGYLKAYGFRDKEKNLPLTEDSVMTGASFSKAAFAYMVMQLVQDKILELDKPVHQYLPKRLPDYPNYQALANDQRYKKITARMLSTMSFRELWFIGAPSPDQDNWFLFGDALTSLRRFKFFIERSVEFRSGRSTI